MRTHMLITAALIAGLTTAANAGGRGSENAAVCVPESPPPYGAEPGVGHVDELEPGDVGAIVQELIPALRAAGASGLAIGLGTGNRHCFPDPVPDRPIIDD